MTHKRFVHPHTFCREPSVEYSDAATKELFPCKHHKYVNAITILFRKRYLNRFVAMNNFMRNRIEIWRRNLDYNETPQIIILFEAEPGVLRGASARGSKWLMLS